MYSDVLRRRTDVCFAALPPIFEDVMHGGESGGLNDRVTRNFVPVFGQNR